MSNIIVYHCPDCPAIPLTQSECCKKMVENSSTVINIDSGVEFTIPRCMHVAILFSATEKQSVMHGTHFANKHSMDALKISSFIWIDMLMKLVSNNLRQKAQ